MESLLIVFLIIGIGYNVAKGKKIQINAHLPTHMKFALLIGIVLFFYLAYRTRQDFIAYLMASLVSIFFITAYACKGFAEEAIYILRGIKLGGLLVTKLPLKKVKKIEINEKKNYLQIKITSDYGQFYEYFRFDQREELDIYIDEKRKG